MTMLVDPSNPNNPTLFVCHDQAGLITQVGVVPAYAMALLTTSTVSVIEGTADLNLDYVLNGVVTPRPANSATIAGTELSNLPNPCTISINGSPYPCADTSAALSLTQSGTYAVKVSAFPYLDANFTVTA